MSLPVAIARERIQALEDSFYDLPPEGSGAPVEQASFVNAHSFCPGVYARTIFMHAGAVLTSRIHKTQHFFVVSKGRCTVVDSHGTELHIEAPYMGVTMPGTKRALRIHEDTIWTTFHATDLTDVAEIEKAILAESFAEIDE